MGQLCLHEENGVSKVFQSRYMSTFSCSVWFQALNIHSISDANKNPEESNLIHVSSCDTKFDRRGSTFLGYIYCLHVLAGDIQ